MAKHTKHIAGMDVGTSKITVIIADLQPDNRLEVIGTSTVESRGLRRGIIVELDRTVEDMKRALEEAELMAGAQVESAWVSAGGGHIRGVNSRGVVAVQGKDKHVTQEDLSRVVEQARAISIPSDQEIFHILPQEYVLDGQEGIRDPLNMQGQRLEASVHLVTGSRGSLKNVVKCVNACGVRVDGVVFDLIASAEAVLEPDERNLGVCLIDIGAGTTGMAVFERGEIWHSHVIPVGGEQVTNDLAVGLRVKIPEAEKIKRKFGCATEQGVEEGETLEVGTVGDERKTRIFERAFLVEIIKPRIEETFQLLHQNLVEMGLDKVCNAGVVITGGGAALDGLGEVADAVFGLPVRIGTPRDIHGLKDVVSSPAHATAVGLLRYGAKQGGAKGRGGKGLGRFWDMLKEML